MNYLTLFALVALTTLSFTNRGLAQGSPYISNLDTVWTRTGIGDIQTVSSSSATYAAHFTTGPGSFSINAITLEFLFHSGYPQGVSAPQALRVEVFEEAPGGNVLLGELSNPIVNIATTQWPQSLYPNAYTTFFDFSPAREIHLNAFSRYSVVLSMPAGSPVHADILFAQSSAYTSLGGWTMGATTSANPYANGEYLVMAVRALPIPEPASTVLLIGGLILLIRSRSRRLFLASA